MKKTIRLTEGMLHRMIKEAIDELDWKTYASAADKQPSGYLRYYDNNQYRKEIQKVFLNKLKQLGLDPAELYDTDIDAYEKLQDEAEKEVEAKEKKMYQRKLNFKDSARNAFDRDFGFEDETGTVYSKFGEYDDDLLPHTRDIYGNENGFQNYDFFIMPEIYGSNGPRWRIYYNKYDHSKMEPISQFFYTRKEAEEYAKKHNMPTKFAEPSKELQAAYQKANREVYNFIPRGLYANRLPSNYEYEKGKGWKLKNDSNTPNYEYEKGKGWRKLKNDKLDEAISKAIRSVLR